MLLTWAIGSSRSGADRASSERQRSAYPGVVITAVRAAHALQGFTLGKTFAKIGAGKLAVAVAGKNHTACNVGPAGAFKPADAQFHFQVVIHDETDDLAVTALRSRDQYLQTDLPTERSAQNRRSDNLAG